MVDQIFGDVVGRAAKDPLAWDPKIPHTRLKIGRPPPDGESCRRRARGRRPGAHVMREEVPKPTLRSHRCSRADSRTPPWPTDPIGPRSGSNQHEAVDAAVPDAAAWDLHHHLHASQQPEERDRTPPIHPMAATSGLRAAAALRGLCPATPPAAARGGEERAGEAGGEAGERGRWVPGAARRRRPRGLGRERVRSPDQTLDAFH